MSDCVEGGGGDDSRGVDAIKAQSMVGGTSGGTSATAVACQGVAATWQRGN